MSSSESETSESLSRSSSLSSEYCSDVLADSSLGILPYQFEPQVSNASEQMDLSDDEEMPDETEEIEDERLSSLEWCKCGNCQNMQTAVECVCCQDISVVVHKNIEAAMDGPDGTSNKAPTCVTEHPGFLAVCTNKWVLQTARYQYIQQYKGDAYRNKEEHKVNRHIAYRQFTRWCWGILGKEIRVVLPSCVVMCIRAHFPPPGYEDDFVFEGFKYTDE